MNAAVSIDCMDSMMNAKEDTVLGYGKPLLMCSTVSQLQLLLMKKYYVCMEG